MMNTYLEEAERLAQKVFQRSEAGSDEEALAIAVQALINCIGHMLSQEKED